MRTKDRMESTVKSTERTAKVAREAVKISSQTADISVKAIIASTRLLSTVLSMESQQMELKKCACKENQYGACH